MNSSPSPYLQLHEFVHSLCTTNTRPFSHKHTPQQTRIYARGSELKRYTHQRKCMSSGRFKVQVKGGHPNTTMQPSPYKSAKAIQSNQVQHRLPINLPPLFIRTRTPAKLENREKNDWNDVQCKSRVCARAVLVPFCSAFMRNTC